MNIAFILARGYYGHRFAHGGVTIRGSDDYLARMRAALDLLQAHVPDTHELMQALVCDIFEGLPSGAWTEFLRRYQQAPITLSAKMVSQPPARLAGTIAHEVWHLHLAAQHVKTHPGAPLPHGKDNEEACLRYEYYVLRRLGLKESELTPVDDTMKTRWWDTPLEEQDW